MTLVERTPRAPGRGRGASGGWLWRLWSAPLWAHAAALALVVLAAFPLMTPLGSFTSDEGAYALQVEALGRGQWEYEYRAGRFDPEGEHFPLVLTDRGEGGYYPYAKHPAYPMALRAAVALLGVTAGLHVLGLLAVVATAAAGWLLAAEVDRALSRPAFWMAASGPVLVNGYLLWAHAPSAALAGLSTVAAVRVARRGVSGWPPVALAVGLAAGVLLRSEALLFAGAVVLAVAWARTWRDGWARSAAGAAAVGLPAVVAVWVERAWANSIVGDVGQTLGVRESGRGTSYLVGRLNGGWHELFQPAYGGTVAALLGLTALVAVAAFGAMALGRDNERGWLGRLLLPLAVAAVAMAGRMVMAPTEPVTGLFAAWPVALLGIALVRWRGAPEAVKVVGAIGAVFVLAVLATQYPEGGGREWGGRFLSPATAIVAVLAVSGIRRAVASRPGPDAARRVATAAVAAVAGLSTVLALTTVGRARAESDRLTAAVARHRADVTISVEPSLPRLSWRADDQVAWMLARPDEVAGLLDALHARGASSVAAVLPAGFPVEGSPFARVTTFDEPALAARNGFVAVFAR